MPVVLYQGSIKAQEFGESVSGVRRFCALSTMILCAVVHDTVFLWI